MPCACLRRLTVLLLKPKEIADRFRTAIKSVTFDKCKADLVGAIKSFIIDIIRALDENNASDVVQDGENFKSLMTKLTQKLEPDELRVQVHEQRLYWSGAEKADFQFFMQHTCALAVEGNNSVVARAKIKNKGPLGPISRQRKGNRGHEEKKRDSFKKNSKKGEVVSPGQSKILKGSKQRKDGDKPCLNFEKCDGIHRLVCSNNNTSKQMELHEKYYDRNKSAKAVRQIDLDREHLEEPNADDGRYRILLDKTVDALALGDYGSHFNVITHDLLTKITSQSPDLPIEGLTPPIQLHTAINGRANFPIEFTASKSVNASITIIMPGSNLSIL